VVKADRTEQGLRKVLNFGHTVGHAVESWSLAHEQKPLLHGEAVAIGMVCEAWLSHRLKGLSRTELDQISQILCEQFPPWDPQLADPDALLELMGRDKKNRAGEMRLSLLPRIGQCEADVPVRADLILESLLYYRERSSAHPFKQGGENDRENSGTDE
jgi:3-dehydroquinate synthase